MENSSSSNGSDFFYHHNNRIFSPKRSYQDTLATDYSQHDDFDLNFASAPPTFDSNELHAIGFGAQGTAFNHHRIFPSPSQHPLPGDEAQAAYRDVSNRPSSNVNDGPWTPTPSNSSRHHAFPNFQAARSTTSGSTHELAQGRYHGGYHPSTNYIFTSPPSRIATHTNTASSTFAQPSLIQTQQQYYPNARTAFETARPSQGPAPKEALSRRDAVLSPQRPRPELKYACSLCPLRFENESGLLRHKGERHSIADHCWLCEDCEALGKAFERVRKHRVQEHSRTVHDRDPGDERCREVNRPPATEPRHRTQKTQGPGCR